MKQGEHICVWHRINKYDPLYLHPAGPGIFRFDISIITRGSYYATWRQRTGRRHSSISYGAFGKSICRSDMKVGTAVRSIAPGSYRVDSHHLVHPDGTVMAIISSKFIEGVSDV